MRRLVAGWPTMEAVAHPKTATTANTAYLECGLASASDQLTGRVRGLREVRPSQCESLSEHAYAARKHGTREFMAHEN